MELMMIEAEAQYHFHEANRLYKEENYLEALQHLAELNNAFPDTFNILYPMLLCREQLGRITEAFELCEHMLKIYSDDKHQQRLQPVFTHLCRIKAKTSAAGATVPPSSAAAGLVQVAPQVTPLNNSDVLLVGSLEIPWRTIAIYTGLVVLVLLVLASLPLLINKMDNDDDANGNIASLPFVLMLLAQFLLTCIIAYSVLGTMNLLLHENIMLDILDVFLFMLLFTALCFIPIIGWWIGIFKLKEHYEMSVGEVILFLLLYVIFNLVFLYLVIPLVFGESAATIIKLL